MTIEAGSDSPVEPSSAELSENVKLSNQDSDTMDGGDKAPTLAQVMMSVLAAFGGVQNKKNKERDFKHGNFKVFVIVAAAFTLLFLLTIFTVVQMVLD